MAVLGSATIVVRAITTGVRDDLKKAFSDIAKDAESSGKRVSESFNKGMARGRGGGGSFFDDIARGIRRLDNESKGALKRLNMMEAAFLNISSVVVLVGGGLGAVISSLVTLVGVLGAVAASSIAAVGALASLGAGAFAAKFALGGVGAAVSQATKSNGALAKSVKQVREELQQLAFDAKDAELSEREAALNVEKTRNNLLRMQDLPPNSIARREAQLQYEQAEQAYKRAKDRAADLADQLKDGVVDPNAAPGADPYAGLTKSQKEFAQRLVDLQPILKSLKEEIAKGFLPKLGDGIEKAVALLDGRLRPALGRLGDSLGLASDNFFNVVTDDTSVLLFERFVDKSGPRVQAFGSIFGNLFKALFGLLDAAGPLIDRFVGWLDVATKNVADFFSGGADNPKLVAFFESVGDTAAHVGRIFGNLFKGLGVLIETTTGPGSGGEYLLNWFEDITAGFANMGAGEKGELKQFFLDSAKNAKVFLQLLGDIFGIFNDIGADPRLGAAFEKLREGVPFLEKIIEPFLAVSGTVAEVFVKIAEIVSLLVDTDTVAAFFNTILNIVTGIRDFLAREEVQNALKTYGPLLAQIGAAFFVFEKLKPIFLGIVNGLFLIANPAANLISLLSGTGGKGGVAGAVSKLGGIGGIFKTIGGFVKFLTGPIGLIITAFTLMFANSEMFRDSVFASFQAIGEVFTNIWTGSIQPVLGEIGTGFGDIFTFIGEIGRVFGDVFSFIMPLVTLVVGTVLGAIGGLFEGIMGFFSIIVNFVGGVINVIRGIIGVFVGLVTGDWSLMEDGFTGAWENIKNIFKGIIRFILGLWRGMVNGFIDAWNGLTKNLKFTIPTWIPVIGGAQFSIPQIPRIPDIQLAMGGTVYPSPGGTIAQIAEAGRPERVEPLDPSGLSQRDRAMIQMLSGGGGGGATINVYPSAGMDEAEIANIVSRKLAFQLRKGGF
jgi:phage-related protein